MKRLEITVAQDSPCHAALSLLVPDDASRDDIVRAVKAEVSGEDSEVIFEDSCQYSGLRIVTVYDRGKRAFVKNESTGNALGATSIDVSPCDLGKALIGFLAGKSTFGALLGVLREQNVEISRNVLNMLDAMAWVAGDDDGQDPEAVAHVAYFLRRARR